MIPSIINNNNNTTLVPPKKINPESQVTDKSRLIIDNLKNEVVKAMDERDTWELNYDTLFSAHDHLRNIAARALKIQGLVNQQLAQAIHEEKFIPTNEFYDLFNKALDLNTEVLDAIEKEKELRLSKAGFTTLNETVVVKKESPKETIEMIADALSKKLEILSHTKNNFDDAEKILKEVISPLEILTQYVAKLREFLQKHDSEGPKESDSSSIALYQLSLDSEWMVDVTEGPDFDAEKFCETTKEISDHIKAHQDEIEKLKSNHDEYQELLILFENAKKEIEWKIFYSRYLETIPVKQNKFHESIALLGVSKDLLLKVFDKTPSESELINAKQLAETQRKEFQRVREEIRTFEGDYGNCVNEFNQFLQLYDEKNITKQRFKNAIFFDESREHRLRDLVRSNAETVRSMISLELKKLASSKQFFQDQILGKEGQKGTLHYGLNYAVSSIYNGSLKVEAIYAQGEQGGWKLGMKKANTDYMMSEKPLEEGGVTE